MDVCQRYSGVWKGESRSPGGENNITVWSNTLLVFTPLHPGRPECKELVVSGRGFSQWRGRSIFFLVRGQAEVGGGFSLLKQHVGEYTNSIAYEGIFAGGDPTDTAAIPTLEGEYNRGVLALEKTAGCWSLLELLLSGEWSGRSTPHAGESTEWADMSVKITRRSTEGNPTSLGIAGAGVSLWNGKEVPFTLSGRLDLRTLAVELEKTHSGAYTNTIAYAARLELPPPGAGDADPVAVLGIYSTGTLTLSLGSSGAFVRGDDDDDDYGAPDDKVRDQFGLTSASASAATRAARSAARREDLRRCDPLDPFNGQRAAMVAAAARLCLAEARLPLPLALQGGAAEGSTGRVSGGGVGSGDGRADGGAVEYVGSSRSSGGEAASSAASVRPCLAPEAAFSLRPSNPPSARGGGENAFNGGALLALAASRGQLDGAWEGESVDDQGMQTGWAETHLTFNCAAKPPDGGPGGHSGLDLAAAAGHQPACGPAEARALSIKGTGVSLWRGKKIPFTVNGGVDLVGGHVVLSKTHSGEYTNSVVYRGKLIGMAGRDASELAGFWARATAPPPATAAAGADAAAMVDVGEVPPAAIEAIIRERAATLLGKDVERLKRALYGDHPGGGGGGAAAAAAAADGSTSGGGGGGGGGLSSAAVEACVEACVDLADAAMSLAIVGSYAKGKLRLVHALPPWADRPMTAPDSGRRGARFFRSRSSASSQDLSASPQTAVAKAAAAKPPAAEAECEVAKGSPAKAAGKDEKGAKGKGGAGVAGAGPEDLGHAAQRQCVVCLDEPPTLACVPCGHVCLCDGCGQHMATANASGRFQCPVCRLTVQCTMRIYF